MPRVWILMRALFGGADRRIRKTRTTRAPTKSVHTYRGGGTFFQQRRAGAPLPPPPLLLLCALESRLRAAVLLIQCEDNKMLKFDTFAWKCRFDDGASFAADTHTRAARTIPVALSKTALRNYMFSLANHRWHQNGCKNARRRLIKIWVLPRSVVSLLWSDFPP